MTPGSPGSEVWRAQLELGVATFFSMNGGGANFGWLAYQGLERTKLQQSRVCNLWTLENFSGWTPLPRSLMYSLSPALMPMPRVSQTQARSAQNRVGQNTIRPSNTYEPRPRHPMVRVSLHVDTSLSGPASSPASSEAAKLRSCEPSQGGRSRQSPGRSPGWASLAMKLALAQAKQDRQRQVKASTSGQIFTLLMPPSQRVLWMRNFTAWTFTPRHPAIPCHGQASRPGAEADSFSVTLNRTSLPWVSTSLCRRMVQQDKQTAPSSPWSPTTVTGM